MNVKVISIGIIAPLILLTMVESQSTFTAYGARHNVGFQDGLSDCRSGTSDAINGHSNAGHHSNAYIHEYNKGLKSCNNSGSSHTSSKQSLLGGKCLIPSIIGGIIGGGIGIVGGPVGMLGGGSAGASLLNTLCNNQK